MDAHQAQREARDVLRTISGLDIDDGVAVVLDDAGGVEVVKDGTIATSPSRLENHYEEYRAITGESYDIQEIINQLPWA